VGSWGLPAWFLVQAVGQKREERRQVLCDDASAGGATLPACPAFSLLPPSLPPFLHRRNRQRQSIVMADAASPEPGRENEASPGRSHFGGWVVV